MGMFFSRFLEDSLHTPLVPLFSAAVRVGAVLYPEPCVYILMR